MECAVRGLEVVVRSTTDGETELPAQTRRSAGSETNPARGGWRKSLRQRSQRADAAQGVEPARLDAPESQESSSHVPTAACPVEAGKAVKATACAGAAVQEAIVVDDDSQRSPTVDASRGSTSASTTSSQLVVDLTLDNGDAADDDCVVVCESATSFRKRRRQATLQDSGIEITSSAAYSRSRGASKQADAVPTMKCVVCLEDMSATWSTPCGHLFCKPCITAAICASKRCPTCRKHCNIRQLIQIFIP
mmetsp:Transcript_483/g.1011  ORF Transcript_483/g.1011 Transcript_483/m.1011 type:complete len:249 (-) Transcript_483:209-955(-)